MALQISVYAFTLWLGLYLIARDRRKPVLVLTGLGLVAYALGLALDSVAAYAPDSARIEELRWPLRFAPALFWFGASVYLMPEDTVMRQRLTRWLGYAVIGAFVFLYGLSFFANVKAGSTLYTISAIITVVLLLSALVFVWWLVRAPGPQKPLGILLTVTLFFALSAGLFMLPIDIFPPDWVLFALGLDMLILGGCIAFLDAFDEGESLLPDLLHSFTISFLAVLIFGGQVGWAMTWNTSEPFPLLALLFAIITAALAVQVFTRDIQSLIDRLIFARFARLRRSRADFRAAADALSRRNDTLDLSSMSEEDFTRLTRRALSNMSSLGKLAASPLTRLPAIEQRLIARGETDNTLARTAELKILLTDSIARLKPRDKGDFGTSDEWRYYNALYFPYVLGLKVYSLNDISGAKENHDGTVLEWFRTNVPERTLHNWQNAAARLIAQDLHEQLDR